MSNSKITNIQSGDNNTDVVNKEYVDTQSSLNNTTLKQELNNYVLKNEPIDMYNNEIRNIKSGKNNNDVVNKQYVDNTLKSLINKVTPLITYSNVTTYKFTVSENNHAMSELITWGEIR